MSPFTLPFIRTIYYNSSVVVSLTHSNPMSGSVCFKDLVLLPVYPYGTTRKYCISGLGAALVIYLIVAPLCGQTKKLR